MKLQEATKREVLRIALGTLGLCAVENIVYLCLGRWSAGVCWGSLLGGAAAVLNFLFMAITVQLAVGGGDEKQAKMKMQLSYSVRMLVLLGVVVLGFVLPALDGLATALPLLFPRIVIFLLRVMGLYKPGRDETPKRGDDEP